MKMTFQPKKRSHAKVHGFRARMSSKGGRKVLAARRAKGRKKLSAQAAALWPFVFSSYETGNSMQKFHSLTNNRDFQSVYRTGKSLANQYLVMYVKKRDDEEETRVGISVSKKVGNSVVRHRLKRLIRESYRLNCGQAARGFDLVIIAREKSNGKTYQEIEGALLSLLKNHHLI